MPYEELLNPDLRVPDRTQPIWRYLDFAQLVAMVLSNALWFARADMLGDEHEGSIPAFEDSEAIGPGVAEQIGTFRKGVRRIMYVNCWTGADDESLAMWNLYSGLTSGVAIRSTVGNLIDSIGDLDQTLRVGHVDYIDYRIPPTASDRNDFETWYFRKRRSFRHEEEIRAIAYSTEDLRLFNNDPEADVTPLGIAIPVDLDTLVARLHVAPKSQDWYLNLVRALVAPSHPQWEVLRSDIDRDPIF